MISRKEKEENVRRKIDLLIHQSSNLLTYLLIIFMEVSATRLNYMYLIDKPNGRTFTASQDCLTIPIRVYPVISVNHLISFTGLDLTARFSRKLLNGTKRDCVIKEINSLRRDVFLKIVLE